MVLREQVRQLQELLRPTTLYFAELDLTPKELALLAALHTAPQGRATFDYLKAAMYWGCDSTLSFKVVLSRLRRKLEPKKIYIHTYDGQLQIEPVSRKRLNALSRRTV
jgi:DNA-binding response OmpR family regulator